MLFDILDICNIIANILICIYPKGLAWALEKKNNSHLVLVRMCMEKWAEFSSRSGRGERRTQKHQAVIIFQQ